MMRMGTLLRSASRFLSLSVLALPAPAQSAAHAGTRLEFRTSPALELWFHVRHLAETSAPSPLPALAPALEAARELARELGPMSLAWGAFEGLLPGCESAADLLAAAARAPEEAQLPGGQSIALRARVQRVAAALVEAEPACAELLAENAGTVALARASWEELVGEQERALFRHHQERLGLAGLALTIPVYLTAHGARPGAVTYFDEDGKGVCFVAVAGRAESELFEVVLHEATHALDLAAGKGSLLSALRDALGAAGFDQRSRPFHDLPHLLMFLQAAESVRTVLAPEHEDYGQTQGVYARMGPRAAHLRERFAEYATGKRTRAELVQAFVAEAR